MPSLISAQSLPYGGYHSQTPLNLLDVFHFANKELMALSWEEAKDLLLQVRGRPEILTSPKLEDMVSELRYQSTYGRLLSSEEMEDLVGRPNQVLIDE